jgi:hypothetical protein
LVQPFPYESSKARFDQAVWVRDQSVHSFFWIDFSQSTHCVVVEEVVFEMRALPKVVALRRPMVSLTKDLPLSLIRFV